MSQAKFDGEDQVQDYLKSLGLRAERFSKKELGQGDRTPDFRVFAGTELAFYCEVKSAQKDEWLEKLLDDAPPLTIVGGSRNDPTYNRISAHIHSAVGQFDSVNPAMDRPNVLAIVNADHRHRGFIDLISVLTGNAYVEGDEVWPIFRQFSEGRIREEKHRIHLYLWFDKKKDWMAKKFWSEAHPAHHADLLRYFKADPASIKRLPDVERNRDPR